MKPAHQTAEGERVSVWVLVKGGRYFGRYVATRTRSAVVTGTLTLWAKDGDNEGRHDPQEFRTETAKGQYCAESDLLAEILRKWGHLEACKQADMGQIHQAFELLGFECWGVM